MNANELADELEVIFTTYSDEATFEQAATMLRQQQAKLDAYKKVLDQIASDYPELSHDKARMQNLDHIKWAKEVLK